MKITKQEIVREALDLIGSSATNNQIRNYGKQKYQINLQANDIWATCGSKKEPPKSA